MHRQRTRKILILSEKPSSADLTMMRHFLSLQQPGRRLILTGNEAIARGAVEAGVRVATSYPGNPCTEILERLAGEADQLGIHAEWSTNEKVALEVAAGASIAGLRSMVSMKHVGLNWAMDPLMCLNLSGVNAGMVIVVGDDPESRASQNEQDSRYYSLLTELPMLEPSGPAEAKDMVVESFRISEELKLPVIIRSVQRLSHGFEDVVLGEIESSKRKPVFTKDSRFVVTGAGRASVELHRRLHEKQKAMKELLAKSRFNMLRSGSSSEVGIITSGLDYNLTLDALFVVHKEKEIPVVKIGTLRPLPNDLIKELCRQVKRVLVVEEVEPFLELQVKAISGESRLNVDVVGKELIPSVGELTTGNVVDALAKLNVIENGTLPNPQLEEESEHAFPPRPLTMCIGCPHRSTFIATKKALAKTVGEKALFCGDIGCYSFGAQPPFRLVDIKFSMGAGLGLAAGIAKARLDMTIITFIGDSTFFHAGIPGLINAVHNDSRFILIILDNMVIGQTGQQPDPGTGVTATGRETKRVILEELVKSVGVEWIRVVDALDVRQTEKAVRDAICYPGPGPAVVISRALCTLEYLRNLQKEGKMHPTYYIDQEECTRCDYCTDHLACPALVRHEDGSIAIEIHACTGCSVCAQICPVKAIHSTEVA